MTPERIAELHALAAKTIHEEHSCPVEQYAAVLEYLFDELLDAEEAKEKAKAIWALGQQWAARLSDPVAEEAIGRITKAKVHEGLEKQAVAPVEAPKPAKFFVRATQSEEDITAGKVYEVVKPADSDGMLYVLDDEGDEYPLTVDQYEAVSKPQEPAKFFVKALETDTGNGITAGKVYEAREDDEDDGYILTEDDEGREESFVNSSRFVRVSGPTPEAPADKAKRRDELLREAMGIDETLDREDELPFGLYAGVGEFLSGRSK